MEMWLWVLFVSVMLMPVTARLTIFRPSGLWDWDEVHDRARNMEDPPSGPPNWIQRENVERLGETECLRVGFWPRTEGSDWRSLELVGCDSLVHDLYMYRVFWGGLPGQNDSMLLVSPQSVSVKMKVVSIAADTNGILFLHDEPTLGLMSCGPIWLLGNPWPLSLEGYAGSLRQVRTVADRLFALRMEAYPLKIVTLWPIHKLLLQAAWYGLTSCEVTDRIVSPDIIRYFRLAGLTVTVLSPPPDGNHSTVLFSWSN